MKKRSKSQILSDRIREIEKEIQNINLQVAQGFSSWDHANEEIKDTKDILESGLIILKRKYNLLMGNHKEVVG